MNNSILNSKIIVCDFFYKHSFLLIKNSNPLLNFKVITTNDFFHESHLAYDDKTIAFVMEKYDKSYQEAINIINVLKLSPTIENLKKAQLDNMSMIFKDLCNTRLLAKNKSLFYLRNKDYPFLFYRLKDNVEVLNAIEHYNLSNVKFFDDDLNKDTFKTFFEFDDIDSELFAMFSDISKNLKLNPEYLNLIEIVALDPEYNFSLNYYGKLFGYKLNFRRPLPVLLHPVVKKLLATLKNNSLEDSIIATLENCPDHSLQLLDNVIKSIIPYKSIAPKIKLIQTIKTITSNLYISKSRSKNILNISDTISYDLSKKYYFLGANQKNLPKVSKDNEFLSDNQKLVLSINTSFYKNIDCLYKTKMSLLMPNTVWISYCIINKTHKNKQSYLFDDKQFKYQKVSIETESIFYSYESAIHYSNMLKTQCSLDPNNMLLKKHLENVVNALSQMKPIFIYDNKFMYNSVINLNNIDKMSRNQLEKYFLCPFSFYLTYILRIDPTIEVFNMKLGSLIHETINAINFDDPDSIDPTIEQFFSNSNLSNFEESLMFIPRIKDELSLFLHHYFVLFTKVEKNKVLDYFWEQTITVDINLANNQNAPELFKIFGTLDLLIEHEEGPIIIDFKLGNYGDDFECVPYGINIQLFFYGLLIKLSSSEYPLSVGLQSILPKTGYIDNNKYDYFDQLRDWYSIDGVSKKINDKSLEMKSKSPKLKFLIDELESLIIKTIPKIRKGYYNITPVLPTKNVTNANACEYCNFKDICYKRTTNRRIIKKC